MGVWLPVSTMAALALRRAGWDLPRVPLTPDELRDALEAAEAPVASVPFSGSSPRPAAAGSDDGPSVRRTARPAIEVRGLTLRRGRRTVLHTVRGLPIGVA